MHTANPLKLKRVLIVGASRGIGEAVAQYLEPMVEDLITVSRSPAKAGKWLPIDVTRLSDIEKLKDHIGNEALDGILYLGGTWEEKAFTRDYDFEKCPDRELVNVLNVNLLGPIRIIQKLLPNLRKSERGKIILMGALVKDYPFPEVANTASKLGLDGVVHALRNGGSLKKSKIGITVIHTGYVATPEVLDDLKREGKSEENAIPPVDLCLLIHSILSLSNLSNINQIHMPAMIDS